MPRFGFRTTPSSLKRGLVCRSRQANEGLSTPHGNAKKDTANEGTLLARKGRHTLRHGRRSRDRRRSRHHHQGDFLRDMRVGSAPDERLHAYDGVGRRARARDNGRSHRRRQRSLEIQSGRPRGRAVQPCLRRMLFLQEAVVLALRPLEPQCRTGDQGDGTLALRPARLLAHAGGIRGRTGGIPAGPLRRCRADQGAGRDGR